MSTETIQAGNKFNQELITKARKGEIAILNDGSVEELQKVLKHAWPKDEQKPAGTSRYYERMNDIQWGGQGYCDLPTHSVKDFFMPDTKDTQQPRTYKVTRQQMKEIWQMLPVGADGEQFRNSLHYLFDPFENEAELNESQVKRIMKDFPEVQPSKLRSIFPEYFFIPEGEPVLCKRYNDDEWRIRVSDGKGGAYNLGLLSGEVKYFKQIIPFTKNPPK